MIKQSPEFLLKGIYLKIYLGSAGTSAPLPRWRVVRQCGPFWRLSTKACVKGTTDWNCPPWLGTTVTICMSYFTTGSERGREEGPGKETRTNKLPTTRRKSKWQRRPSPYVLPTSQNPPHWNPSWLSNAWATMKNLSQNDWPETTQNLTP